MFELNLSEEELKKRTDKTYLLTKTMISSEHESYKNLSDGDKEALLHLLKAGKILEDVYLRQDNEKNKDFKKFLEDETVKGNELARLSLILFNAQKGMSAIDRESNMVYLAKGEMSSDGKGFYPSDLTKEEFHTILIKMLKQGKTGEVKNILTQRSMVVRDGEYLKGIDYTEFFKDEFSKAADELEIAAKTSTNKDFNEYLTLQANALRNNDPMLDAYADKKWAELQEDAVLEFTISREQYADMLTGTVIENEELKKLLEDNGIEPLSKDSIGIRIGIINKKGTENLLKIKKYIPMLAGYMPFKEEYEQNITEGDDKQTMVDVDLAALYGDEGAYRGGITVAQNLPNNDKLSLTIGGGRRNVYHRQIREIKDKDKLQKRLDATLDKSLHKYFDAEASHKFTIGHENVHSLGPKNGTEALGKYKNIIEENKADMGSMAFLDILVKEGMYTEEEKKQIIVTFCAGNFMKSEPPISQAHRVRSVMQTKYFLDHGAVSVDENGLIHVDMDKVVPTAMKMLEEIVRIQIDRDFNKAEDYINRNFVWTDEMERVAKKLRTTDLELNGRVEYPLADELLK